MPTKKSSSFLHESPQLHKHTFLGTLPSYFARQARPQVRELYLNSAILDFAVAMILFFEPIYLYTIGFSLRGITLFYIGVYVLYFIFMPLGGKFIKRYGIVSSIFLGSPFLILYYLSLVLIVYSPLFLVPAMFCFALQKSFYWPGFHTDFVEYGEEVEQGREVSNVLLIILGAFVLGPLVGGIVMHYFGFVALFIVVAVLIVLSNFPLLLTPPRVKPEKFSYRKTYARLFSKQNQPRFIAYLGFGEEWVLWTLWPIFMFIVLGSNNFSTGLVVAGSTLVTAVVVLYIGKLSDRRSRDTILRFTTVVYAIAWVVRVFVRAPLGLFAAATFGRIGKSALSVPLTVITYHNARQSDDPVEGVILFELALVIGKLMAMGGFLVILAYVPPEFLWQAVFILAALFTLFYSRLHERA